MPASHEKTWQFDLNVAYTPPTVADQAKWVYFQLKNHLLGNVALTAADGSAIGTGSIQGKWTCLGSSDGTNGAMDGQDRWTTAYDNTKIVAGAGAHSWITLRSPLLNGQYYYLTLTYANNNAYTANYFMAAGAANAPTGGNQTTDPTQGSTWSTSYWSGSPTICDSGATSARKFHFMMTSEGNFYACITKDGQGYPQLNMALLPVVNPGGRNIGGWSFPQWGIFTPNDAITTNVATLATGGTTYYNLFAGGSNRGSLVRNAANSASIGLGLLVPTQYYNLGLLRTDANWSGSDALASDYPFFPAFVGNVGTGSFTVAGRIPDFGVTWGAASASTDDGSNPRFQTVSNLVIPCPQTGPISF